MGTAEKTNSSDLSQSLRPAISLRRSQVAKTDAPPRTTLAKPSASTPPAASAAADGYGDGMSFLDLPSEIRIMIYELLLISPDPILISPRRRHLRFRVVTNPVVNGNTYLRARRPTPEKSLVRQKDGLHVGLLGTCKQVNSEGTALLYGKNQFVVGQLMPLPFTGAGAPNPIEDGYHALYFFLWSLRLSTLSQINSITFRKACYCTTWLLLDNKEFVTDGMALRKKCFPGNKWPDWQLPRSKQAKETFKFINSEILVGKGPPVFMACPRCHRKYRTF